MSAISNSCSTFINKLLNCSFINTEYNNIDNNQKNTNKNSNQFQLRTKYEIDKKLNEWISITHPRVNEMWDKDSDVIEKSLKYILKSIDANDDPITPSDPENCIIWHGPVSIEDNAAVIPIFDKNTDENTYVLRLMSFFFADTSSFNLLLETSPEGPLKTTCNNSLCVNMTHIIVKDEDNG